MIEQTLQAFLVANAGVAALVGTRIYPVVIPQGPTYPLITYQRITEQREGSFAGPNGLPGTLIQVDCWANGDFGANGYAISKAVADAVRLALDGYSGTPAGGNKIQSAILENQTDLYEPEVKIFRVLMEFRLWWNEPQA